MRIPKPPRPPPNPTWLTHVEALNLSGMKVPVYAAEHGIKPDTLYRWRRRYRALPTTEKPGVTSRSAVTPRLVPVSIEVTPSCELVMPDGRLLRFPVTLSAATLRGWLDAMRSS